MASKPFLCRLGFHQTFNDTIGNNIGTVENPIYMMNTYQTCNNCGWTTRPPVV